MQRYLFNESYFYYAHARRKRLVGKREKKDEGGRGLFRRVEKRGWWNDKWDSI